MYDKHDFVGNNKLMQNKKTQKLHLKKLKDFFNQERKKLS